MFAQALLAISEHRIWVVQAVGFATAGIVLMMGRFVTAYRQKRSARDPQATRTANDLARRPEWQPKPHTYHLPTDLHFKVEEAWR